MKKRNRDLLLELYPGDFRDSEDNFWKTPPWLSYEQLEIIMEACRQQGHPAARRKARQKP